MKNLLFILLFPGLLLAATNVQYYERSHSMLYESTESVGLEDSLSPEYKDWMLDVGYSYKSSPLTLKSEDNRTTYTSVIDWFQTLNVGGAYRLNSDWSIGFSSVLVGSKISGKQSVNLSDSHLRLNYRRSLNASSAVGVHFLLTTPTGKQEVYTSDEGVGAGIALAFEQNVGLFQYVTKVGYLENGKAFDVNDANLDQRKRLQLGLAMLMPLSKEKWFLTSDFEKSWTLPVKTIFNPNELKVGVRYATSSNMAYFAGFGIDSITNSEPVDTRIYIGLKYSEIQKKEPAIPSQVVTADKIIRDPECYDVDKLFEGYNTILHFPNNKDTVSESSKKELERLILFTKENFYKISHVTIHGHASKPGSANYNYKLSKKRAVSMGQELLELGLDKKLLEAHGKGVKELLTLGNTEEDHEINRRVEIKVWIKELKKECK